MEISADYLSWMRDQVNRVADNYDVTSDRAFAAWAIHYALEVAEDDAFNQSDTLQRGDAGIDGWHYDHDAGIFHLVQAKYSDDPTGTFGSPGTLDSLFKAAMLLRDPEKIEKGQNAEKLRDVALALKEALDDGASVSLDFFIAGRLSEESKKRLTDTAVGFGESYTANIFDIERLYEMKLSEDPIEDLAGQSVTFKLSGKNEYFERSEFSLPGVKSAGVFALDGRSLADAVAKWGPRLFHGNVRYYLKKSNRVNKAMLGTLDDAEKRKAFWLYNNGITLVAESFEFRSSDETGPILIARNPQIVNGAQTSSVFHERRASLEYGEVAVQARIIAIEQGDAGRDALREISQYTNSQSPVRAGDLRANENRHRRIQSNFGMLTPPIFYERRRGEWQSLTPADRKAYNNRRVTKEDIGQRYLAFQGLPADAISKRESMFGDLENQAFDPSVSAKEYLLAYELYEQASNLLKASNSEKLSALAPSLGNKMGGDPDGPTRVDALRPAHKLVCAHATALAHEVLIWRFSSLGQIRATAILERMAVGPEDPTCKFVWLRVWQAISLWLASAKKDNITVKVALQRPDAFSQMNGILKDALAEAEKTAIPSIS
ncbi:AIPR family protein [Actinocorallia sp. B10E7]|uniref:AIPR family protein n=1 Tax=Actinocorallia sp. B10E7 TaxID=3153558 RepID=UPI00325D43D8